MNLYFGLIDGKLKHSNRPFGAAVLFPAEALNMLTGEEKTHPEKFCQKCGGKNPVWFANNDLFNKVNGSSTGIICPSCFEETAEQKEENIIFKCIRVSDEESEFNPCVPIRTAEEIITKRLENWHQPMKSSIEYYAQSGKITGTLFIELKAAMEEYAQQFKQK